MTEVITLEDLARRTGERPERIREWRDAGLVGSEGSDEFSLKDVGRCRLLHDIHHYGMTTEAMAKAVAREDSTFRAYLEMIGEHSAQPTYTLGEVLEYVGMEMDQARRLMEAAGIHDPGDMMDNGDVEFFRSCKVALEAGMPEEALLQILRVYSDNMARVAEVGARVGHFYMHQPMMASGLSAGESMKKLEASLGRIEPLVQPAILYFHHKGIARAQWEDMLMHLEEEAGLAEKPEVPGQIRQAIMFVDLASFTPLAEAMGDIKATQVLQQFSSMVRAAARRCHGRIVKQIGDAFMLMFSEPHQSVICALELDERSVAETQFPAVRSGIHWGPVLYREGDYFGSNVNVASRLAEEAQRHQVLITGELWRRVKDMEGVEFVRLGNRRLKGLAAEVEAFEVRPCEPTGAERFIDPVCGMELRAAEVAARLTLDGREHAFCSDDCLRKYIAAPERYALSG